MPLPSTYSNVLESTHPQLQNICSVYKMEILIAQTDYFTGTCMGGCGHIVVLPGSRVGGCGHIVVLPGSRYMHG